MGELAAELSYCADSLRTREASDLPDLLLRPAVNGYGLLQFDLFDEIMHEGYDHAVRTHCDCIGCLHFLTNALL